MKRLLILAVAMGLAYACAPKDTGTTTPPPTTTTTTTTTVEPPPLTTPTSVEPPTTVVQPPPETTSTNPPPPATVPPPPPPAPVPCVWTKDTTGMIPQGGTWGPPGCVMPPTPPPPASPVTFKATDVSAAELFPSARDGRPNTPGDPCHNSAGAPIPCSYNRVNYLYTCGPDANGRIAVMFKNWLKYGPVTVNPKPVCGATCSPTRDICGIRWAYAPAGSTVVTPRLVYNSTWLAMSAADQAAVNVELAKWGKYLVTPCSQLPCK